MEITGKVLLLELNATIKGSKGVYKGAELIYKEPGGETKTKAFPCLPMNNMIDSVIHC